MLEKKGDFSVVTAYDGVEGLEKVKSENPDVIVLDTMMPNKDGYQFCTELKSDDQYKNIPIILLTAVTSHIPDIQYTPEQGLETEADCYLNKPVEPREILNSVNKLLADL